MGMGDDFGWYNYDSDDGNTYLVRLSADIAGAGFFAPGTSPLSGGGSPWPWHYSDMRHVTGYAATGERGRCPLGTTSDPRFATGGSWTAHGRTYTIIGALGERRPANHLR